MKRLTTNCPDNNLDAAMNLFYIKDSETWVRGGGDGPDYPDIRLYDFIRKAAKILLPDLDVPMDDDSVDYAIGELLLDGPDEPTGLLALLYTAAWSYAELRGRLMQYEDTGLEPAMCANYKTFEDEAISKGVTFKRIVALMEADRAGRLVVLPFTSGRTLLCKENIDSPRLMKDVEIAIRYCSSCGIVFHMDYNVFCDLVKHGRITAVSEETEKALEAMKDG